MSPSEQVTTVVLLSKTYLYSISFQQYEEPIDFDFHKLGKSNAFFLHEWNIFADNIKVRNPTKIFTRFSKPVFAQALEVKFDIVKCDVMWVSPSGAFCSLCKIKKAHLLPISQS